MISGGEIAYNTITGNEVSTSFMRRERLVHAANLFTQQHLQRLDKLELVKSLMWKEYQHEKSPAKRVSILQAIVSMQPYLSGYYDATTYVLSKRLKADVWLLYHHITRELTELS